jgi:hypothetical protein
MALYLHLARRLLRHPVVILLCTYSDAQVEHLMKQPCLMQILMAKESYCFSAHMPKKRPLSKAAHSSSTAN